MKTALILSGGGSRGAYEIGVCKALKEMNIPVDMVYGTSVGAITGALVAQGSRDIGEKMWLELTTDKIFDIGERSLPVKKAPRSHEDSAIKKFLNTVDDIQYKILDSVKSKSIAGMPAEDAFAYVKEIISEGGAGTSGLQKLMSRYIREDKIRASEIEFGLVTVEYPNTTCHYMYEEDIPQGLMLEYILASASCFPAVQVCDIGGKKYIDGGYGDNLPIKMALDRGAHNIIAVNLDAVGIVHKDHIKQAEEMTASNGGYFKYIESHADLGNFLNFNRENTARLIEQGHIDCLRTFGVYEGENFAFEKDAFSPEELKSADKIAGTLDFNPLTVYNRESFLSELLHRYSQRRSAARFI